ncbi:hypothetical protein MBLNU459_g2389t1 [Dothideomycetes sp. NU459]
MAFIYNILIATFALILYLIVPRAVTILGLERHAPSRLQRWSSLNATIRFIELKNCEDALMHEGISILSCDSGRDKWNTVMGIFHDKDVPQGQLYIYDYRTSENPPIPIRLLNFPNAETDFHPLGIEYSESTKTLLDLPNTQDGEFLGDTHTANHIRTLEHPLLRSPNSIYAISDQDLYVTNDHYILIRYYPWLAHLETYLGIPGGSVVHVDLSTDTVTTEARINFANGVVALNETTLAVASTTTASIYFFAIDPKTYKLAFKQTVSVPFLPDNLSLDSHGTLLIAGHAHPGSITAFAHSRARCNSPDPSADKRGCDSTAPSYIAQWNEASGLSDLYIGDSFSSATTAVRDAERGIGLAVGLYERGILCWGQENPAVVQERQRFAN